MQEILFKAKTVDTGEWVYGYYVRLPDAAGSVHMMHVPANNPDESNKVFYIDPETLGQFTGLTDKNGTKIFEGDVVRISEDYYDGLHYSGYEVYYSDGAFCVEYETQGYDVTSIGFLVAEGVEVEVYGNIYDNPELIGGTS